MTVFAIVQAFPLDAPIPRPPLIHPFPADPERAAMERVLCRKRWDDLDMRFLEQEPWPKEQIVTAMTDAAFAYFLPAFLVICVREKGQTICLATVCSSGFPRRKRRRKSKRSRRN